jgi:hypothetical protein
VEHRHRPASKNATHENRKEILIQTILIKAEPFGVKDLPNKPEKKQPINGIKIIERYMLFSH